MGRNIAEARKRAKITGKQLADRTIELGYPIPHATIANIENGRRESLTVQELAVLARALAVPPVMLMYDTDPGPELVEVLPERHVTPFQATEWYTGEAALPEAEQSHTAWLLQEGQRVNALGDKKDTSDPGPLGRITARHMMARLVQQAAVAAHEYERALADLEHANDQPKQTGLEMASAGGERVAPGAAMQAVEAARAAFRWYVVEVGRTVEHYESRGITIPPDLRELHEAAIHANGGNDQATTHG
jgi:transcriptional regulator with XRE-family HTH domain